MEIGLGYLQSEKANLEKKLKKEKKERRRVERILVKKFRGKSRLEV